MRKKVIREIELRRQFPKAFSGRPAGQFGMLLVAGVLTLCCAAQAHAAASATAPAATVCTLGDVNNEKLAVNPTPERIKAAMGALDADKVQAIYLKRDETHCIQVNWEGPNSVSLQYLDGDEEHPYRTTHKHAQDVALKLLLSYASGKDDWRKMVEWEPER